MLSNKRRFWVIFLSAALLLFVVVFKYYSPLKLVGEHGPEYYGEYIASDGKTLFVLAENVDKLLFLDISTPDKPELISTLTFPEYLGTAAGITLNGNYLYVVSKGPQGILIVDVSNPESPRIVANYPPLENSTFNSRLIISNNIGYVSHREGRGNSSLFRLSILSMKDPLEIKQLSIVPEIGSPLWQVGDYLYVEVIYDSSYDSYLGIVDVSNPEDSKLIEQPPTLHARTLTNVTDADANDREIFFSSYNGLLTTDISNSSIQGVIKYPDYWAEKIIINGNMGYFLRRLSLYVVDLSSERKSDIVFLDSISQGMDFVLVKDHLYVADSLDGLLVYKINRNTPAWRNAITAFGYGIEYWLSDRIGKYVP